jgi:hypothetical protein
MLFRSTDLLGSYDLRAELWTEVDGMHALAYP